MDKLRAAIKALLPEPPADVEDLSTVKIEVYAGELRTVLKMVGGGDLE